MLLKTGTKIAFWEFSVLHWERSSAWQTLPSEDGGEESFRAGTAVVL